MSNENEIINNMEGFFVIHKAFGRGIIKTVINKRKQEDTIVVDFDGKKDCKFVFPSAFLSPNQFLRTNEPTLVHYLDAHCRCAGCKELKKSNHGYEGSYLCDDCNGKYIECRLCGNYKLKDDFKKLSVQEYEDPDQICSNCFNEQSFTCEKCNRSYLKKYKPNNKYLMEEHQLCDRCLKFYYNKCHSCGEYAPDENTVFTEHRKYCYDCFEKLAVECERCGERFVPFASECYCEECRREISETAREKAYLEEWKKYDFHSRKIKELGFFQLKNTSLVDFMTQFHPESEGEDESYDILVLYGGGVGYVLLSKKKTQFKDLWPYACDSFTMSQIKKDPWLIYFSFQPDYYPEIINLGDKNLKLWKKPICIRAHTRYDEDYRKEWIGRELEYEGNEYGDTTAFFIIGEFVNKE